MAAQLCPGVATLTISGGLAAGDIMQNVLHFYKNDGTAWGTSDLTNLVNSFDTWLGTAEGIDAFLTHMQSSFYITELAARDLTVDGGAEFAKSVSHVGLDGGEILATGLSFAITLRTGLVGRSFRGRLFKWGLSDSVNTGGGDSFDSTIATDIEVGYTNLISVAAGWSPAMKWVVLSRRHNNVERGTGIATPIVSIGHSNLAMDYQRRRAPFHQRHH